MQKLIPDNKDMEMFDNGVLYVNVHFVTVPMTHFKTYDQIVSLSQMYNAISVNKLEGLVNIMFQNINDAKTFAKKVNEQ